MCACAGKDTEKRNRKRDRRNCCFYDSKITETGYFYLSQQLNFLAQQITSLDNKIDKLDEKLDKKIGELGREINSLRLWAIGTVITVLVASISWWAAMLVK